MPDFPSRATVTGPSAPGQRETPGRPIRALLMGAPGAGKGTQGALLAELLGVPAVSTGDIFRANLRAGTALGRQAQQYMDAGEYVPDQVTNDMVRERLSRPDASDGWLLDGYPRTVDQVAALDRMVQDAGTRLDLVVELRVDPDELVRRLADRAVNEGRTDDTEAVIRRRQDVYAAETAPLLLEYDRRGLLVSVDGGGDVGQVQDVLRTVVQRASRPRSGPASSD